MSATPAKRRANIAVTGDLLAAARELDLNVSAIAEKALDSAVRDARAAAWLEENAGAIAQRKALIEKNGLPLTRWQMWKPE